MQFANYHAHSNFSDGHGSPETYLQTAIGQGLKAYGFADHAPIPLAGVGVMSFQQLPYYLAEIDRLKAVYADQIQIYKSLEVDYIPNVLTVNSPSIKAINLDYTVGAVHYVDYLADGQPWGFEGSDENFQKGLKEIFKGDIQACITRYYELIRAMVNQDCPNVVAHLDRIKKLNKNDRYFSERAAWYQNEVIDTLDAIADANSIMEINTKGYYKGETEDTYPGKWVLEIAHEMGIPFLLSSDAHHPEDITKGFKYAVSILRSIGVQSTTIFMDGEWIDDSIKRRQLYMAHRV